MEVSGTGKSPNTTLSFRYNANNEELEELYHMCDDDPPTPQCEPPVGVQTENASPKKADKGSSILDKYFKSMRTEKPEKVEDKDMPKSDPKPVEEVKLANPPKEATASPMKEYLNRLGKRNNTSEGSIESRESSNETWKIFHDFKFKIAQAVEDIKTRSVDETKEKSVPRENSMSDSEENSAIKDDQQSVGDTDNQVSSLDSSIQNLSEMTQPITAKPTDIESSLPLEKNNSESSDDTHKNLVSESAEGTGDLLEDSCMMDVESGVEALEDTNIDGFGDINALPKDSPNNNAKQTIYPSVPVQRPSTPANFGSPPSKSNIQHLAAEKVPKSYFLNLTMYILTFIVVVNYFLFPDSNVWNGFFLGIWFFYFLSSLKEWVIDNYLSDSDSGRGLFQLKRSSAMPPTYTIPVVKEHRHLKKFEDWVNHYRFHDYDPYTYHINKTTTAFIKLEGCNLRLSYTRTKIAKRALWDEKIEKVSFYQHRLYNLSGARIVLLPKGLTSKRQWSKKYPICIILNEKEKIQVLERETAATLDKKMDEYIIGAKKKDSMQESEATETSPEKKRKFVWRRREKSLSHSEGEPGKEGLRQRFVRKMHRDKKTDSVSISTEPDHEPKDEETEAEHTNGTRDDADEEIDEADMAKLKDFLEETERESVSECSWDGEWSVHVKQSRDKHAHLYLFGRTGRNKHELYRRLKSAIYEANQSAESSAADDRTASDPPSENKDGAEMATYNVIEEKTVTFARSSTKQGSLCTEASSPFIAHTTVLPDLETYEKTFWPFLIKIMQTHEMNIKLSADAGVMCQIEPTPRERSKTKKKRKSDSKNPSPTCHCRMLPAEVSWVNTVLARVFYDVMRDPAIILRVQNKIQRKLNTLKLPSFMSPLIITELSLAGACPLVERVAAPAWDERGVWLDADLRYDGGACITILTQINLMKLKEKNMSFEEHILEQDDNVIERDSSVSTSAELSSEQLLRKRKPAIFDSDVEDSAESSSDDEAPVQAVDSFDLLPAFDSSASKINATPSPAENPGSSKKKFLRMVDKISTNKYFQQVTDFKYIKRAMEGLSNTDIKLQLEVQGLEGRLAFNLPPPPHDRLWIGFRTNPQLVLKARPAVGARTLRFAHITNWIEHKLNKEFEKFLVLPNMEDISVDIMTPTPVHFE